jgi:hypothetical protein
MDLQLLGSRIAEKGLKKQYVAEHLGLTYPGFYNKMRGIRPFTLTEISLLRDLLSLDRNDMERIFFADDVEKKSTKEG